MKEQHARGRRFLVASDEWHEECRQHFSRLSAADVAALRDEIPFWSAIAHRNRAQRSPQAANVAAPPLQTPQGPPVQYGPRSMFEVRSLNSVATRLGGDMLDTPYR